ncbi:hypothetical protein ACHQM5_009980 [Ranunculus cassubicifolius]
MQISGLKEIGANTMTRPPTDHLTRVPIKKRKIQFIRPPSPPPQLPPEEPIPEEKQETTFKGESSSSPSSPSVSEKEPVTLNAESSSTAGSPTPSNPMELSSFKLEEISSSSAVSPINCDGLTSNGIKRTSSIEENKENSSEENMRFAKSDVVLPEFSLQTPTIETSLGGSVCSKSTSVGSDDTVLQKIEEITELPLGSKKDVVEKVNEEMQIKNVPSTSDKRNLSDDKVTEELFVARDGSSNCDGISQDGEGIGEEKLDPCSWNLALTERQTESNRTAGQKFSCSHPQRNRDHWDLNTMMDTWEGSIKHSSTVHEVDKIDRHDRMVYRRKCNSRDSQVSPSKRTPEVTASNDKSRLLALSAAPKNDIILHLSLGTSSSLPSGFGSAFFGTSTSKTDLRADVPGSPNFSNCSSPPNNLRLAGSTIVKSEPSDDSSKQDRHESSLRLMKGTTVKSEPCVAHLQQLPPTSNGRLKLITCGSVKMEPVCEQGAPSVTGKSQLCNSEFYNNAVLPLSSLALPVSEIPMSSTSLPITPLPLSCRTSLSLSNNCVESNHPEIFASSTTVASKGKEAAHNQIGGLVASKYEAAQDISGTSKQEVSNVDRPESSRVKSTNKIQIDSLGSNDAAGSDEEKLNLFDDLQDDCSSDTDDELGGKHCVGVRVENGDKPHGEDDDDYEDGEVREPLVHITTEIGLGPYKENDCSYHGMLDKKEAGVSGFSRCADPTLPPRGEGHEDAGAIVSSQFIAFNDIQQNSKQVGYASRPVLQEPLAVEIPTSLEAINSDPRGILSCTVKEDFLKGYRKDLSDGTVSGSQGISLGDDQGSVVSEHDTNKGVKHEETKFSVWSKTESLVVGTEATKDGNGKCNQSRIINLARAFSGTSPSRMRSYQGRFLPSRVERERYNDSVRNGDKLHHRSNRDDGSTNKYERHRNQEQPPRTTGSEFMHGRGRTDKRYDPPHAAVTVSRDCPLVGSGRKLLRDELPNIRHLPSRRRSPGGRGRHVQIVSRSTRDISPDRLIARGEPNLIGLRHEKKFMRGLPDDMMDTGFSRSQPQYQQVDDHFARGERSFSPLQRKGPVHVARIRSRSPSRARSPGPWSSPRRRSPDSFGRGELVHRRSPPFFRVRRLRSPRQRPVFSDDIDGRRHGSPPYLSRLANDIRDSRDPDHARSFIPNRSPSGRVLARGTRRFDMVDPRERIENDDYFAGPMQSDRFHENGGDGGSEGRRVCGDRRRSFRPTYDTNEAEKFHFHVEGASRPYRFSPEPETEFHEGGNLRDREFERRVKNRQGNTPRRTRSVEEQEENYRHGEQQVWDGAGFDDVSPPGKRRRF